MSSSVIDLSGPSYFYLKIQGLDANNFLLQNNQNQDNSFIIPNTNNQGEVLIYNNRNDYFNISLG